MGKNNVKFTLDFVKKKFEDAGCVLLSTEYKNARTPLDYICECGQTSSIRYDNFRVGKRCKECGQKKSNEKRKHDIEFVRDEFTKGGCVLLATEYINSSTPLKYLCECKEESVISYTSFKIGSRCEKCRVQKISGVNSYMYKPQLTDEDRLKGRNDVKLREWRKKVFERDDYTCFKCNKRGKGELNAHHINSYNLFPGQRYVISNGITLCEPCHRNFHNSYGFGDNTAVQMLNWMKEAS